MKDDPYGQFSTDSLSDIQSINDLVAFKKEIRKVRLFNWICNFACMVRMRGILSPMALSCY